VAGTIRLFEKDANGLLHEVDPSEAEARRMDGTTSRVSLQVDVLWTAEELEQRDQQAAAALAARQQATEARQQAEAEKAAARQKAEAKLAALGLTPDEVAALRG
jgi:hypothetical protein